MVRTLVTENLLPGAYSTSWDGRDNSGETVPTGNYISRLFVNGLSQAKKRMTLVK